MKTYKHSLKETRKYLRNNSTYYENLLWREIRNNKLNIRFRRQVSIGDFIVDFAALKDKIIIEIDGQNHFTPIGRVNDTVRDEILTKLGFKVLRFENQTIKNHLDLVLEAIKLEITKNKG